MEESITSTETTRVLEKFATKLKQMSTFQNSEVKLMASIMAVLTIYHATCKIYLFKQNKLNLLILKIEININKLNKTRNSFHIYFFNCFEMEYKDFFKL